MDSSVINLLTQNSNRKVRKLLGRAYLREYRLEEALDVYLSLLRDYPNDFDSLIILGNLYRLAGSSGAAEQLYQRVLDFDPDNEVFELLAALKRRDANDGVDAEDHIDPQDLCDPLDPSAVSRLAMRLMGEQRIERQQEICEAADILDKIGADHHPADDAKQLMPALIELNIRQARAAGYAELAETLQSLQISLIRQVTGE